MFVSLTQVWSYVRMVAWTALGMAIYFLYGISHSVLFTRRHEYSNLSTVIPDALASVAYAPLPEAVTGEKK